MLLALLPRVIKAAKSTCVACLLELWGGCTGDRLLWLHNIEAPWCTSISDVICILSLLWLSGCLGDRSLTFVVHPTLHLLSRLCLSNCLSPRKPVSQETVVLSPITAKLRVCICLCVRACMCRGDFCDMWFMCASFCNCLCVLWFVCVCSLVCGCACLFVGVILFMCVAVHVDFPRSLGLGARHA